MRLTLDLINWNVGLQGTVQLNKDLLNHLFSQSQKFFLPKNIFCQTIVLSLNLAPHISTYGLIALESR